MKKIVLVLIVLILSVGFIGCSNNSIQFKRDSKFSEVMKNLQINNDQPTVKRSSGVVIYKDTTESKSQQQRSGGFGPGDINFDIKMKY